MFLCDVAFGKRFQLGPNPINQWSARPRQHPIVHVRPQPLFRMPLKHNGRAGEPPSWTRAAECYRATLNEIR